MPQVFNLPIWGARAGLTVIVDNDAALAALAEMARRLQQPPPPVWNAVGQVMRDSFRQNFAVAGRPAWQPLAERTVRRKTKLWLMGRGNPSGKYPPKTPTGRIPRRLLQNGQLGPETILVMTGALRDSWCVKDARGHYERVEDDGATFRIGSQLTLNRTLEPEKPLRPYMLISKREFTRNRLRNRSARVMIPLAMIHEKGAPNANIPPRPVGVVQQEDRDKIAAIFARWAVGAAL
jgi:phage gpG-like protein